MPNDLERSLLPLTALMSTRERWRRNTAYTDVEYRMVLKFSYVVGILLAILALAVIFIILSGLPARPIAPPPGNFVGAFDDVATDPARREIFEGVARRVVPFQTLYPAEAAGTSALYLPQAAQVIPAISEQHGWYMPAFLARLSKLPAPWTHDASPVGSGPIPIVLYLAGATGYMQMSSFQTTALAAHGYIVVTLDQPGVVAAAVLPDGRVIKAPAATEITALVAPSYRATDSPMPAEYASDLAPQTSIIPYFAADVSLVLDRLTEINEDSSHPLFGLLDLESVGIMGVSLGAIITAEACMAEARIKACLMMDAPAPSAAAAAGLIQPSLWLSRPVADQRRERAASGGWPEEEIQAQADSINQAVAQSDNAHLILLPGLFHIDFTDLPAIQPTLGWLGQSGTGDIVEAHDHINALTLGFFDNALKP